MDHQQIVEELEALRVRAGRHMKALDSMTPVEKSNAILCDIEKMKQITREMEGIQQ